MAVHEEEETSKEKRKKIEEWLVNFRRLRKRSHTLFEKSKESQVKLNVKIKAKEKTIQVRQDMEEL